jgi:hypothetical protein
VTRNTTGMSSNSPNRGDILPGTRGRGDMMVMKSNYYLYISILYRFRRVPGLSPVRPRCLFCTSRRNDEYIPSGRSAQRVGQTERIATSRQTAFRYRVKPAERRSMARAHLFFRGYKCKLKAPPRRLLQFFAAHFLSADQYDLFYAFRPSLHSYFRQQSGREASMTSHRPQNLPGGSNR